MSKSDLLGTGAAFSNARRAGGRSERGRAKAVAQGDVPAYELIRIPLDQVSPTPLNPRRNFGTDEEKSRFGEELRQAQLSACVVVSRSAYLGLWPDHGSRVGAATHILINGERRFRSALHVGLEALDFVVRDDLAASRTDFIDHLLAENLEREDFDVIERARGVQQLVDTCADEGREHGARSRAAERLGRSPSWVTNQLVLLELPEEIQLLLSSGELPERDGRLLARTAKDRPGVSAAELLGLLQQNKQQEAEVKAAQREILRSAQEPAGDREPAPQPARLLSADKSPAAESGSAGESEPASESPRLLSADKTPALESGSAGESEPAPEPPRLLSADKSLPSEPLPPTPSEPVTAAPAPLPTPPQSEQIHEPEGVIPSQMRTPESASIPWQDPKAMYEAIWTNMTAKHRAELTMLLIENNRHG
ncbi:ParB/RepB/Spo0J family partition protein [Streptomyces sp. NBC_00249]|uniref:ParB/RepB/Spo0J family partition protein n=1 Tax=Streptomyces sp. NBC_00249 TaxID=2975690 RepID=UPI00224D80AD|nr:ParB/RepB/Spo0J family partition protein [Streptomyces sp. NBC_00249]MCX5199252.1 ParB/RepB/Spo0J family partition protein [Streptomyces sp. NBC_00249]